MTIENTEIQGCYLIRPHVHIDERGYFYEAFNLQKYQQLFPECPQFVQDNEAYSVYGVIRGLHMQQGNFPQAKLVKATQGCILDIAVDIRIKSPTYGKHVAIELSSENKSQLYIPHGCLHGYAVLSQEALVAYKCDNYYHPQSEYGIRFDDPQFGINWQIKEADRIISKKDLSLSYFDMSDTPKL